MDMEDNTSKTCYTTYDQMISTHSAVLNTMFMCILYPQEKFAKPL